MTFDQASAVVIAALITGAVHLLSRVPDWLRRRAGQPIKTDEEVGAELRDALYRQVRQLQEDMTEVRRALAECERESNQLRMDNDRLQAQNNDMSAKVRALSVEVEVLRRLIGEGRR